MQIPWKISFQFFQIFGCTLSVVGIRARARVPNSKPTQISIFWWEFLCMQSAWQRFWCVCIAKIAKKNHNCRNKYQKNIKMCPCPLPHSRDESQTSNKTTNGQLNHQHHSDDGMQKLSVFFLPRPNDECTVNFHLYIYYESHSCSHSLRTQEWYERAQNKTLATNNNTKSLNDAHLKLLWLMRLMRLSDGKIPRCTW